VCDLTVVSCARGDAPWDVSSRVPPQSASCHRSRDSTARWKQLHTAGHSAWCMICTHLLLRSPRSHGVMHVHRSVTKIRAAIVLHSPFPRRVRHSPHASTQHARTPAHNCIAHSLRTFVTMRTAALLARSRRAPILGVRLVHSAVAPSVAAAVAPAAAAIGSAHPVGCSCCSISASRSLARASAGSAPITSSSGGPLMKAQVLTHASKEFKMGLEQLRRPKPQRGEVLVKVRACGVCHTDLHVMKAEVGFPIPAGETREKHNSWQS
jgi:hypothetical protein